MVNHEGKRFADEGADIWPKRYASWGELIAYAMRQPVLAEALGLLYPKVAITINPDQQKQLKDGEGGFGKVLLFGSVLGGGFIAGTAGIAVLERRMRPRRSALPPIAGGDAVSTIAPTQAEELAAQADALRRRALATGLSVAVAIGIHNFAEGLAIGVSAKAGEISLATVLIIGFALHNATEGFGIVGPLGDVRPSWRWLGLAGLIGGGPVFLGSVIGYNVTSEPLELAFYALAGGAILYVIGEVWQGMRRYGHRELGLFVLGAGFTLAVITDMVVVYGGG